MEKENAVEDKTYLGNTNSDDRELGRDHFVYFSYGKGEYLSSDSSHESLTLLFHPKILQYENVIVGLEDPLIIGNSYFSSEEHPGVRSAQVGWEEYKKQVWRGKDFSEIFPLMVALSYENPQEYLTAKNFSGAIYPKNIRKP